VKKYHATIMVVEDDPNDQFLIEQEAAGAKPGKQ
jgi:hypothetical protein